MEKKIVRIAGIMTGLAVLFTIAVCVFDVQAIGPMETKVGFATINKTVADIVGVNMEFYTITEILGYAAIGVCLVFGFIGLKQVIQRKSVFKVDCDILALGVVYIATIILYVVFNKVGINYRPVILPGETVPEASFPSSHTMLVCTVMGTAMIEVAQRVENLSVRSILVALCWISILVMVAGRLLCGVHWATDVFGGILYGLSMIFWFVVLAFKFK